MIQTDRQTCPFSLLDFKLASKRKKERKKRKKEREEETQYRRVNIDRKHFHQISLYNLQSTSLNLTLCNWCRR